jgi:uncharacterized membrane protein YccC
VQRDLVAGTGAVLLFMTADLRVLCRRYRQARNADQRPWTVSVLQAIGRIARQHAIANRTAALIAGVRAALAVLLVGGAWIASGWVGGSGAIVGVAMTCTLFALVPDPPKAAWQVFAGCLAGWLTGFVFSFFVLPSLDTFTLLGAAIAIVVMVGAYFNTFPKTAVFGISFNLYFCFIVGISNRAVYDPGAYLDTGLALLCGIATAAVAFSVLAPSAGEWLACRYLADVRALISRDARDGELDDELLYAFEQNVRDCIMQIASAPACPRVERDLMIASAFAVLETGRAMILLRLDTQRHGDALPAAWADRLQQWLSALADLFDARQPEAAERAERALAATRAALAALEPTSDRGAQIVRADEIVRYRMRALLCFAEFTLSDDALAAMMGREPSV